MDFKMNTKSNKTVDNNLQRSNFMKNEYKVEISFYENGFKQTISYSKNVNSLDELKQSFLKRFGNINDAPNKAMKEKALVKKLTYTAKSLPEWVTLVNTHTRWNLSVR